MLQETLRHNLPEKEEAIVSPDGTETASDAFTHLKEHFNLRIDRDHSKIVYGIDSSRRAESEPEIIGDKLITASLSERMVKKSGCSGQAEELLVITVTAPDIEKRYVLTENGMVSYNSGRAGSWKEYAWNFTYLPDPGYPFSGWKDAKFSSDPRGFRSTIFEIENLVKQ